MTFWEAAKGTIGANYPFDDEAYKVGLTSVGLDPNAEYKPGKCFDLSLAQVILFLITSADIKEGGYAVNLDRDALERVRRMLLDKWDSDTPAGGPTLRDRSDRW